MKKYDSEKALIGEMMKIANRARAERSKSFFKCGRGEYSEGDQWVGISTPVLRAYAKQSVTLSLCSLHTLMISPIHEFRLLALFILVYQMRSCDEVHQKEIVSWYLTHGEHINNWDLVDVSASPILGYSLINGDRSLLTTLAHSTSLWERRIAIVATHAFIRRSDYGNTLRLALMLMNDPHDLIHKAVGWMLREVGKRDALVLIQFLDEYAARLPRTTLRYAIERFDDATRRHYRLIPRDTHSK